MALLAERFNFLVIGISRLFLHLRHFIFINVLAKVLCGPIVKVLVEVLIVHLVHDLFAETSVVLLQLVLNQSRVFLDLPKRNRL